MVKKEGVTPLVPERSIRRKFGKYARNWVKVAWEKAWHPAKERVVNSRWNDFTAAICGCEMRNPGDKSNERKYRQEENRRKRKSVGSDMYTDSVISWRER